ncbi:UNVERIFIED_CONTAM: hypothetical protein K2H54_046116 [Gekko kuhli]
MAAKGHFEQFNSATEDRDTYVSQFQFYVAVEQISDVDFQKVMFLSSCGKHIFDVAQTLVAPAELQVTNFATIKPKLCGHFSPKSSATACRHAFHKHDQAQDSIGFRLLLWELLVHTTISGWEMNCVNSLGCNEKAEEVGSLMGKLLKL